MGFALAGGLEGLGQGLVQQAENARAERLLALKRQWDQEDTAAANEFTLKRDELGHGRDVELANMNHGLDLERLNHADRLDQGKEQRGYAREDGQTGRRAAALQEVFASEGGQAKVRHISGRLDELGYPKHVQAGIIGNLMQESGVHIDTAAVGDNGNSYGAGQWNGPRKKAYLAFAQERGADPADLDTQIAFLDHELKGSERKAFDALMATSTPEEAARVASEKYWRPGDPRNENRVAYSEEVWRVIADPDTPDDVRDDLRRVAGLDQGTRKPPTNQFWGDLDKDGIEERIGYVDGDLVMVPGPDGGPIRNPSLSDADGDGRRDQKPREVKLSASVDEYITRLVTQIDPGASSETMKVVQAKAEEIRKTGSVSDDEEAVRLAVDSMVFQLDNGQEVLGADLREGDMAEFTGRFAKMPDAGGSGSAPASKPTSTGGLDQGGAADQKPKAPKPDSAADRKGPKSMPTSPDLLIVGEVYQHPKTKEPVRWDGDKFVVVE